jgi:hypothetical protein
MELQKLITPKSQMTLSLIIFCEIDYRPEESFVQEAQPDIR